MKPPEMLWEKGPSKEIGRVEVAHLRTAIECRYTERQHPVTIVCLSPWRYSFALVAESQFRTEYCKYHPSPLLIHWILKSSCACTHPLSGSLRHCCIAPKLYSHVQGERETWQLGYRTGPVGKYSFQADEVEESCHWISSPLLFPTTPPPTQPAASIQHSSPSLPAISTVLHPDAHK